jgi:putative membrane protein
MSRRVHVAAAGGTALLLGLAGTASASTSDGTPKVVNREVVQAELDSAGALDVARLFSQLSVIGKGTVHVADPTSSKGLRNLDGFGAPSVRDGKAQYTIHVDGTTSRRTVSDYTKALPVTVSAVYTLGGKSVRAKDIVGKTGDVTATYTVTNVSGVATPVSWKDGKGVTHTETVDLVTPLVGQISTTLPGSFTDLATPAADVAADGRGGTILTYSMVLFGPIGNETQTFTWSGHVKDGEVPAVTVQVLPASPTQKPELNTGVVGYRDGAAQAAELTVGAGQIDANLLKLQSGAGDLLAGLTKLAAGASALQSGLADEAAPGAKKLADGAADAKAGSAKLAAGLGTADAGASDLADGIGQILDGVKSLPADLAADPDYQALLGALSAVQAGIGTATDMTPTTLLGGLNLMQLGVSNPACNPADPLNPANPCGAVEGLNAIKASIVAAGPTTTATLTSLITAATLAGDTTVASGLTAFATALSAQTTALVTGLTSVVSGLTDELLPGFTSVKAGLNNPACDLNDPTDAANPCGIKQVQGLVSAGIGQLVDAISSSLADVLDQASAGADDLADGTSLLAAGAGQLDDGLGQISSGASDLSDGIAKAADGSTQLAEGLDKAKGGDKQVVDGAGELRAKGTQALVAGGNATAGEAGKKYATLVALSDKVADGAMPYGAPEGATGSAAYQLTLAAADTTSHDNRNRAVAAVLLLLAACAVSWLVRRRTSAR